MSLGCPSAQLVVPEMAEEELLALVVNICKFPYQLVVVLGSGVAYTTTWTVVPDVTGNFFLPFCQSFCQILGVAFSKTYSS